MGQYLTKSRKRILQLIDEGLSSKEIAGKTHNSVRTIDTHRYHINKLLGVHSSFEAVQVAKKKKLL